MSNRPHAVMLFAAGFGTRMAPLTDTTPKPLIPVAGKPLIDHALDQVRAYGADRVVVNTHYRAEMLGSYLAGRGVLLSDETGAILETGGGLRAALPLLGPDPVFTMNTDSVWNGPNALELLAHSWDPDRMDALLLCVEKPSALGHVGSGDFIIADDGRITRGAGVVYTGLQILRTELLENIPEPAFSLNAVWNQMLERNRVFGRVYPGQWCDVGQPSSIPLAESMLGSDDV